MCHFYAKTRQRGLERLIVVTTDEMDYTTLEERNKLVAFCENCEEWWKFTHNPADKDFPNCPKCGGKKSAQIGFQIISQRTFDPVLHGKKKFKKTGKKRLR